MSISKDEQANIISNFNKLNLQPLVKAFEDPIEAASFLHQNKGQLDSKVTESLLEGRVSVGDDDGTDLIAAYNTITQSNLIKLFSNKLVSEQQELNKQANSLEEKSHTTDQSQEEKIAAITKALKDVSGKQKTISADITQLESGIDPQTVGGILYRHQGLVRAEIGEFLKHTAIKKGYEAARDDVAIKLFHKFFDEHFLEAKELKDVEAVATWLHNNIQNIKAHNIAHNAGIDNEFDIAKKHDPKKKNSDKPEHINLLGSYLGSTSVANVLDAFSAKIEFSDTAKAQGVTGALTEYFQIFGQVEGQKMGNLIPAFATMYITKDGHEQALDTADKVNAVVGGIMLLNADLHSGKIKDNISKDQFVRNTKLGAPELDSTFLEGVYDKIAKTPLTLGQSSALHAPQSKDAKREISTKLKEVAAKIGKAAKKIKSSILRPNDKKVKRKSLNF